MENENQSFFNISDTFARYFSQMVVYYAHDLWKEIDKLVKVFFLLSIMIFNMMGILATNISNIMSQFQQYNENKSSFSNTSSSTGI